VTAALEAAAVLVAAVEACVACGHPTAAHDAISLRYCAGTQLNGLKRTCICAQPK
jgi:hypothetical protein